MFLGIANIRPDLISRVKLKQQAILMFFFLEAFIVRILYF